MINNRYKHSDAAFELGWLYFHGESVASDYKKAYSYFELGSQWNYSVSTFMLGRCTYEGKGVEKSRKNGFDKMFQGAAGRFCLAIAAEYAKQMINDCVNPEAEYAYFGKRGYYYSVLEAEDSYLSNCYVFYYISYKDIISGNRNRRKLGSWKLDGTMARNIYMAYAEGAMYIIVGDGERGALFKITDNDKKINKINSFKENIINRVFWNLDENAGVIRYGSKGASECEYAYK